MVTEKGRLYVVKEGEVDYKEKKITHIRAKKVLMVETYWLLRCNYKVNWDICNENVIYFKRIGTI